MMSFCNAFSAKNIMKDEWRVGRVIARPYIGKKKGEFKRTSNRHDYALKPTGLTTLNVLKDHGFDVIGVGITLPTLHSSFMVIFLAISQQRYRF